MRPQHLDWDSRFFELRIGRLDPTGVPPRELERRLSAAFAAEYDVVYVDVDARDTSSVAAVRAVAGPHLTTKVVYEGSMPLSTTHRRGSDEVRVVTRVRESGLAALEDLAVQAGWASRFRRDPRLADERVDELYREWMRKSVSYELADEVFVATSGTQPVGVVTATIAGDELTIPLVAVAGHHRGRGVATSLLVTALAWGRARGVGRWSVVTQEENRGACRLYESLECAVRSSQRQFHAWNPTHDAN